MKFYRLEKESMFTGLLGRLLRAFGYALLITIIFAYILGYKFMIVSSGSMEPRLPVGSLIIVTPRDYDDLELGDIVTMNKGGYYLTHRINGKIYDGVILSNPGEDGFDEEKWGKGYWYTKGDNSNTKDGAFYAEELVGVVYESHCFAWIGDVVTYIKGNAKMLIADAIILVIFLAGVFWIRDKMDIDDIECYENDDEE